MSNFINHEAAYRYTESLADPASVRLINYAYSLTLHAEYKPEGAFDVYYFARIMEELAKHRDVVAERLRGAGLDLQWGD